MTNISWRKTEIKKTFKTEVKHILKRLNKVRLAVEPLLNQVLKRFRRLVFYAFKQVALFVHFVNTRYWAPFRAKLISKSVLLQKWDTWKYRPYARTITFVMALFLIGNTLVQTGLRAAPDLSSTWDLSNSADYEYSDAIEMVSGVARLKAQNYTSDANTKALYHMDESGGTSITDSSANSNNATLNGGSFTTGNLNNAVSINGISDYIKAPNSSSLQLGQSQTIEGWVKFNSQFDAGSKDRRNAVVDKGDYQLYFDNETGKLTYELADSSAPNWTQAGGGWETGGKRSVSSNVVIGSNVYAGIGNNIVGDAEVWKWDGSTWTKIGGDGVNGGWADQVYEEVTSLATDGTNLYAGLGNSAGDGEVWKWDGSTWTKIGGDGVNGGWAVNTFENVPSLHYFGGNLYAGLGASANDAEVWKWNGIAWTKIGGDSINGGWTTNYESVLTLENDGTNLYAGLGISAGDAEVWRWNGSAWTQIGGDGLNNSWNTNYESVRSLTYLAGNLYAGIGDSTTDAEVWRWNGTAWVQIGGDGLNNSWNTNYESVYSLANDGTNIYAGIGNSDGDGEVWRWNGTAWVQIGGDGLNNSWATSDGDAVFSVISSLGTVYAGTYNSGGGGYLYSWDGTDWTSLGGQHINNSWGYYGQGSVEVMQVAGNSLYAGLGTATGSAQVWQTTGAGWKLVGGQGVNNSWTENTFEYVSSMSSHNGDLYVGLGASANDAEVWKWDGTTWTKIGGDSINSGWTTNYEEVNALASFNGELYAGLGNSSRDAEVWKWNGSTWSQIGGDGVNSSWPLNGNFERVSSIGVLNGELYVGLGASTGDAEVWRWNGSTWLKVGGDGVNSSWPDLTYEQVESMMPFNNKLYVGLGNSTDDAEVWEYDGTTWTKVGGDDVNGSWTSGTYERVRTIAAYSGELYAGLGSSAGDGEVWKYTNGTWVKLAGNGINGSWGNTIEEVRSFSAYKGKLYAGTGSTANADANVWSLGDNGFLQSTTSAFDTNWHHVAATYDGSTMKIYIDGVLDASVAKILSVKTSSKDLYIGSGYGGREYGKPLARFEGSLDEIRLSSIARSTFNSTPYTNTPQTISPTTSIRKNGVWHWDTISHATSLNGGSITYRISADDGVTWLYWNGSSWVTSSDLTQTNDTSTITTHFASFPVTFDGMRWQAVLKGNGDQQVTLDAVDTQATSDSGAPSNPATITAYKTNGGNALTENSWTNGSSPYFTWTTGNDAQSGVKGYCVYLGSDNTANPITTKGLLGNSPSATGGNCQYVVSNASLDLATPGALSTPLTSSNSSYYISVRTIDLAGNVSTSSKQFAFKFDNTAPSNPSFITAPSGFVGNKQITMTWPSSGTGAPDDANSGLAGLQYRIGPSGTWYGDSHTGSGDSSDLLANDGSYMTIDPIDFNNLVDGINVVYFRTWDNAGNITTNYVTASLKINTNGAPSEPNNLAASPISSTTNSFSFNWDTPTNYVGDAQNITYCYTVNTVPNASNCAYTAPGSTELTIGPYATQPGTNTMYVVARDESSNINYANYASTQFTANTPSPGIPLNTDIVDVSIKTTSNWRLALTWEQPTFIGGGIANYKIYRSTNGVTFTQVGSSTSTTYIDANLTQQTYHYRVAACDSTNNCGATGTIVNAYPTGKFTVSASLISQPTTSEITTKKATIRWTTDRTSDSKIALGTASGNYSPSEIGNSTQVAAHEINLDNLAPGTTYYYVAKWTDEDGNTGTSTEHSFTTSPAPSIKEVVATNISLSDATVEFTTKGATKATVYYGTSESFGGLITINTSTAESRYQVQLKGLSDGTKYYYMISTYDTEGSEYKGNIASFTTPPRPRITNLQFQPVTGEPTSTQKVSWDTNVASSTQVSYGVVGGSILELQDSKLTTNHEIVIRNLKDDSRYNLIAQSRDSAGNLASSDQQIFKTALDTRPPKISDVVVEASIRGTGSEARGQIVVSWRTDEPATSQVAYAEGSGAVTFNSKTAEDTKLTTEHLVIISDLPTSRVFSVQPISQDGAGNEGTGQTETAIVGRASDSVLTIVFNTLRSIFGL